MHTEWFTNWSYASWGDSQVEPNQNKSSLTRQRIPHPTPPHQFVPIEILQSTKILTQNLLFDKKEAIKTMIMNYTTTIVLNHKDAVAMREISTPCSNKPKQRWQGMEMMDWLKQYVTLFLEYLWKHPASNADELSLTRLLHEIRSDREQHRITEFLSLC